MSYFAELEAFRKSRGNCTLARALYRWVAPPIRLRPKQADVVRAYLKIPRGKGRTSMVQILRSHEVNDAEGGDISAFDVWLARKPKTSAARILASTCEPITLTPDQRRVAMAFFAIPPTKGRTTVLMLLQHYDEAITMAEQLPPRIQPVTARTLFRAAKRLDSRKLPLHARAIAERLAELQREERRAA